MRVDENIRSHVRSRAGDRCEYCRLPQSGSIAGFHVEHVRARQHQGLSHLNNLAWACSRCNAFKGPNLTGIDPITGDVTVLFNPRTQNWEDHFAIIGVEILGLTDVGRTTCELLRMNDPERLRLREELSEEGKLED